MSEPEKKPNVLIFKWDGDQPAEFSGEIADAIRHPDCIEVVGFNAGEAPRTLYKRGSEHV